MARLIFDVKDEVKALILKQAKKQGVSLKIAMLSAMSAHFFNNGSLLEKEYQKKSLTTKATKVK